MARHEPVFVPRQMQAAAAAHYIGVSPSKLRTLNIRRKKDGGNYLYDRADLDAYCDSLPYEGEISEAAKKCDEIFGRGSD